MGLQEILDTLHRKEGIRVDIGYGEVIQLDVCHDYHYSSYFEIYPPLGILFICSNVLAAQKVVEKVVVKIPENSFAQALSEIRGITSHLDAYEGLCPMRFIFAKYSEDTIELCTFLETYFSFVKHEDPFPL